MWTLLLIAAGVAFGIWIIGSLLAGESPAKRIGQSIPFVFLAVLMGVIRAGRRGSGFDIGEFLSPLFPYIDLIFVILGSLSLGLIAAWIAKHKDRSFWWWWLYGTLLALVAIPHALLMHARKKCDSCAEWIKTEARRCRHCGTDLTARELPPLRKGPVFGAAAFVVVLIIVWPDMEVPDCHDADATAVVSQLFADRSDYAISAFQRVVTVSRDSETGTSECTARFLDNEGDTWRVAYTITPTTDPSEFWIEAEWEFESTHPNWPE